MTYEGIFDKCRTLEELRQMKNKLFSEVTDNFRRMQEMEIEVAYRKRRKELRKVLDE